MTLLTKFSLKMGLCCIQFMTELMRAHNEAFQEGRQSQVSHKSSPDVAPISCFRRHWFQNFSCISIRQLPGFASVYSHGFIPHIGQEECTPWYRKSVACWRLRGRCHRPWWVWHVSHLTWLRYCICGSRRASRRRHRLFAGAVPASNALMSLCENGV